VQNRSAGCRYGHYVQFIAIIEPAEVNSPARLFSTLFTVHDLSNAVTSSPLQSRTWQLIGTCWWNRSQSAIHAHGYLDTRCSTQIYHLPGRLLLRVPTPTKITMTEPWWLNHVYGYGWFMVNYGKTVWSTMFDHIWVIWLWLTIWLNHTQKTMVEPWFWGYGSTIWSTMVNHGQPWLTIWLNHS